MVKFYVTGLHSIILTLICQIANAHPHPPYPYVNTSQSPSKVSNQVSITTDDTYRYITSNGVPYSHGAFPNAHNPSTISAQSYKFRVPLKPQVAARVTPLQGYVVFGVAVDGVPFDPGTAEMWQNDPDWRYEAMSGKINLGMDYNNAHVQPNGAYHYHALPTEVAKGINSKQHSPLIGYAADGFPIYALYGYAIGTNAQSDIKELESSYQLRQGTRTGGPGGTYDGTFTQDYVYVAGSGDLDECNGRITVTPNYPQGTYAYFITDTFPLIPRCFKGTPDPSFNKQGDGRQRPGRMHSPPPR